MIRRVLAAVRYFSGEAKAPVSYAVNTIGKRKEGRQWLLKADRNKQGLDLEDLLFSEESTYHFIGYLFPGKERIIFGSLSTLELGYFFKVAGAELSMVPPPNITHALSIIDNRLGIARTMKKLQQNLHGRTTTLEHVFYLGGATSLLSRRCSKRFS